MKLYNNYPKDYSEKYLSDEMLELVNLLQGDSAKKFIDGKNNYLQNLN